MLTFGVLFMHRYNDHYDRGDMSIFAQVTLGILAATLIIGTFAGIIIYLKNEAEERQILIWANEFSRSLANIGSPFNRGVNKAVSNIALPAPKTKQQIVKENSAKVYQEAIRGTSEFRKVYQKPERCNMMKDHETRVFCANDFIRAKKEWDKEHLPQTVAHN
jgi:hypothetical protein